MDKTISPSKSGIPLGILFGVIMIFELVISFVADVDPISNPLYGTILNVSNYFLLPVALIALGCNAFKTKINSGYISFGECLKIGVTICLIAGLIYGIFSAVFNIIFPEFPVMILHKTRTMLLAKYPNFTPEQIEMQLSMIKKFMNPIFSIPATTVMYAFIGLIYSLIVGAIVKKENPQSL